LSLTSSVACRRTWLGKVWMGAWHLSHLALGAAGYKSCLAGSQLRFTAHMLNRCDCGYVWIQGTYLEGLWYCCWVVVTHVSNNAEPILSMLLIVWEHQSHAHEAVLRQIWAEDGPWRFPLNLPILRIFWCVQCSLRLGPCLPSSLSTWMRLRSLTHGPLRPSRFLLTTMKISASGKSEKDRLAKFAACRRCPTSSTKTCQYFSMPSSLELDHVHRQCFFLSVSFFLTVHFDGHRGTATCSHRFSQISVSSSSPAGVHWHLPEGRRRQGDWEVC